MEHERNLLQILYDDTPQGSVDVYKRQFFALFIPSTQLHKITILSKFTLIYVRHLFAHQVLSFLLDHPMRNPAFLPGRQGSCLRAVSAVQS